MPMQEGPYFDELAVGQEFGGAPGITLTSGLAAAHQAITGDRLVLATDHDLCRRITGGDPLASPSLVWDVAIGQSTVVTQHVKANLFYRGLAFRRAPRLGDTLRTSTQVVALKQNQPREGRAPTGLAVLRITTVDQQRRPVLDFWRCAMLPLRDGERQTGYADDLASVGQAIDDLASVGQAIEHPAALVSGWRMAEFAGRAAGPRLAELRAGQSWAVPGGDVVSGAPELARLTLNIAMAHHDAQAAGGQRLVYGGHTVGLALAQAARSLPSLVTVAAWHGCDHLGPVHEGDTLRSTISVEQVDPLPGGGGLVHLRSRVRAEAPGGDGGIGWPAGALSLSGLGWPGGGEGAGATGGRDRHEGSAPRDVLDWRYIAVVALRQGQPLCGPHQFGTLAELQKEGLIRHLGLSAASAAQLAQAQATAPVVTVQNLYNVASRKDDALVDRCAAENIAFAPFFPLGGFTPLQSQVLADVAARLGASPHQVALAWLLQRSPAIVLIPGTSSVAHLRENVAAADLVLPPDAVARLDTIGG